MTKSVENVFVYNSVSSLIVKLLSRLDSMSSQKKNFFCWIPSHIRVSRNKRADWAAKSALDLSPEVNYSVYWFETDNQ